MSSKSMFDFFEMAALSHMPKYSQRFQGHSGKCGNQCRGSQGNMSEHSNLKVNNHLLGGGEGAELCR